MTGADLPGSEGLVAPPPAFDAAEAADIADRHFDRAGTATELGGERDQNFRIQPERGDPTLLKISNPADDTAALDLQARAIDCVAQNAPELPVMAVVETVDGDPWTSVEGPDGETHLVRMFTFMPGRNADARDLSRDALLAYGEDVARHGRALRGFFHPAADYEVLWDLRHTPALRDVLDAVPDPDRRALAERVLDRFDDRVTPVFQTLRHQVVHNDLTLGNVLLDDDDRVSGVLDFGDLTHTALVCDLAIAVASAMYRRDDPLAAAEAVTRGYVGVTPLEREEASVLGDLVAARLVGWGLIVAWRLDEHPEKTDHTADGVDHGWALLEHLDAVGFDAVTRRLRAAALAGQTPYDRRETDEVRARRPEVLGSSPLSYQRPVHITSGDGVWLVDPDGERYLDAYNNVQVVGHGNPRVADAIAGQARTLATNTRYLHEAPVTLAERLLDTLPDHLDHVVFVNSGSEANDLAWRLATAATGNDGALVTANAYHGITDATAALSPEIWPPHPPDHVETVPAPVAATPSNDAVAGAEAAIASLDASGHGLATFLFDSLFTSDGIHPPTDPSLAAVADRVRDAGGLVVADEVQAGFGRTGTHLWGFQSSDVVPDVVTFGKPMGNGHPVAAVATTADVAATLLDTTGVFSTYGGNPVSCTAALAVLDELRDRDLLAHAATVGDSLRAGLVDLAATHEVVADVRGTGLMTGVELTTTDGRPATDLATGVVDALRDDHVLIGTTGAHGNVLKIRPPLVFDHAHADHLLETLAAVLPTV